MVSVPRICSSLLSLVRTHLPEQMERKVERWTVKEAEDSNSNSKSALELNYVLSWFNPRQQLRTTQLLPPSPPSPHLSTTPIPTPPPTSGVEKRIREKTAGTRGL